MSFTKEQIDQYTKERGGLRGEALPPCKNVFHGRSDRTKYKNTKYKVQNTKYKIQNTKILY